MAGNPRSTDELEREAAEGAQADYVIVTGLSGAGRSTAGTTLEDLGWEVIDNLPARLIPEIKGSGRICLVVGRNLGEDDLADLQRAVQKLRAEGDRVRMVFLEASDDVLVQRFEKNRRRHPVSGGSVADAIEEERRLLAPIKGESDLVVDTSRLNVHELRDRLRQAFDSEDPAGSMQTSVVSFGYGNGLPLDVDLVLDCRFLPNPYWVDELRPQTGLDAPVRDYVLSASKAQDFLQRVDHLFELVLPGYVDEGKSYLTVAVGCTGGRHRSVALAEEIGALMRARGFSPTVVHRDLDVAL
ncbi:MAG: RNase adapter RapZ [Actinobacteria bacterium]|nr:RNase adapter RapZ [Actinomycetota bacterium]